MGLGLYDWSLHMGLGLNMGLWLYDWGLYTGLESCLTGGYAWDWA